MALWDGWGLPRLWYCGLDWTGTADHLLGVAEGTTERSTETHLFSTHYTVYEVLRT